MRKAYLVSIVSAVMLVVGCGDSRPSFPAPVVPVCTARFEDGTPLAYVQLYFVPTKGVAPAFGSVAVGSCDLTTVDGKVGICPGEYVVYVRPLPTATKTQAAKGQETLARTPVRFKDDGGKSPLAVVVDGGTTELVIKIPRK